MTDRTVFYQDRDCRRNFFSLNDDLLSRHIVLIGGSGSGKTNVFNLTLDQLRKNHQEQDILLFLTQKGISADVLGKPEM